MSIDESRIMFFADEAIDDYTSIVGYLKKLTNGKTDCTLYITDNYFTSRMSTDTTHFDKAKNLICIAGNIKNIILYSDMGINNDYVRFKRDIEALGKTVNLISRNIHGRYWIIDDMGFYMDNSFNNINNPNKVTIINYLKDDELADIKIKLGI